MVRRSFTAVLEKNSVFTGNFETEPFETGWASEARFFVRVIGMDPAPAELTLTPQLSPDGLFWCDEGGNGLTIQQPGLYSFPLHHFGHWLRLKGELQGATVKVLIYLALKE